ncbi:MAG TPA: hypothetical protein VIJ65_03795 [Acidobacteriaceae bacterium]
MRLRRGLFPWGDAPGWYTARRWRLERWCFANPDIKSEPLGVLRNEGAKAKADSFAALRNDNQKGNSKQHQQTATATAKATANTGVLRFAQDDEQKQVQKQTQIPCGNDN